MRTPIQDLSETLYAAVSSVGSIGKLFDHDVQPSWIQDFEFGERAQELGSLVEAAVTAARNAHFQAALAVIRTAIEHQAIDSLLLLGATNQATRHNVDDETFWEWERARDTRDDILEVTRTGKHQQHMTVKRQTEPIEAADGTEESVSFYYWAARDFRPATLSPDTWPNVFGSGIEFEKDLESIKTNQRLYSTWWKWSTILDNLQVNELVTDFERTQINVHYSFLSAFTHGQVFVHESYVDAPFRPPLGAQRRDALIELVLQYSLVALRLELLAFAEYIDARPRLDHIKTESLIDLAARIERQTSYFWFRGGRPTDLDRRNEYNHRLWHNGSRGRCPPGDTDFTPKDLNDLSDSDIHYYDNPLDRLLRLSD